MPTTFLPSGNKPLLVRGTVQESFHDSLPNTSRYAWPVNNSRPGSRASFPSRSSKNPFFARHNPHPQRVRHLKGLLDVPVCTVIDSTAAEEDSSRFLVSTPTIDQMRQRPLKGLRMPINAENFVVVKEKAVPCIGLVPITQTWREELRKLTEAAGLKTKNPYTLTNAYQGPGSRQGERPRTRSGEVPPSRNGERNIQSRMMSRESNRPMTQQGERPGSQMIQRPPTQQEARPIGQDRPLEHITLFPDNEGYMMELLGGILQTDSVQAVQSWLMSAPDREKELVLDMIRAVTTSDREFREGYNTVIRSPTYEDQLLQQEASIDVDAIKQYNEVKKKEKDANEVEVKEDPPKSPRANSQQSFTQYKWTSPGCKPSSPFIATEKKNGLVAESNKARPGTAEAEIEEIRSRLQSRSSPRVFAHQNRGVTSRPVSRPATQQSLYIPPTEALNQSAQRPPSHQSIKSQQSVIKSILSYKPQQNN
ncbi:Protein TBATA [Exaiptasia diaphana]|nr:Protein TBATA [Exaiptasia diaphana]